MKENKYSIIGGDVHKLIRIKEKDDWSHHPWRVHEEKDWYWVPVKDCKAKIKEGNWFWLKINPERCEYCKKEYTGRY